MSWSKGVRDLNRLFSIVRKGQLIVKDTEKVGAILTQRQARKNQTEELLGPKTKTRNRFKAVEV